LGPPIRGRPQFFEGKAIFTAASKAQAAVDHLRGLILREHKAA
jgi:hypothetical protein